MQRTPSESGPPPCWGHGNDPSVCEECRYAKSCSAFVSKASTCKTVFQACLDIQRPTDLDVDHDAVVASIRHLWEKAVEKPIWRGVWDGVAYRLNKILPQVLARCVQAGWDPAIYVQGQVESLTPLLKSGVPLSAGMFHGPNAERRFQKWVERRQRVLGSVRENRTSDAVVTKERHFAATLQYAHARCIGGASRTVSTHEAVSMFPGWEIASVTNDVRLQAFSYVLGCIDPSLPHRILLDPAGRIPSWREIREVCEMLRTANKTETADLSSLGEVL